MTAYWDASKDNWWLSVGHSTVGDGVHRSLTNKLMRDRWIVCQALENARVDTEVLGGTWVPMSVRIMKNGEPQSEDVI